MQVDLLQGFYLDDIFVEPATGRVNNRDGAAYLSPVAAEVLLYLARQAGVAVDREELQESIWGRGTGSPEALDDAVDEIRHALEDHPENPRFIESVPQCGYRLIVTPKPLDTGPGNVAPDARPANKPPDLPIFENLKRRGVIETAVAYLVTGWLIIQFADVVFDQLLLPRWVGTFVTVLVICGFPIALLLSWFFELRDGRAVIDTRPMHAMPPRRVSRVYVSIIAAMAIASVGVLFYDRLVGLPEETVESSVGPQLSLPPVRENSIAVLPFSNIDGGETAQIFAHGLAEDVINRLASIPGLAVAARGDAFALPQNPPSAEVRRRLRVAYYLEGSVRVMDNVLRVVVQLIDSETGFQVVSRDFDRRLENFTEVQREITRLTVANLRVALPEVIDSNFDFANDSDVDAYILYRRGKDIFDQPRTRGTIDSAIAYYERSLAADPGFAPANAGLCNAYVALFDVTSNAADMERAESACATALSTNPNLHMVYTALGDLYLATSRQAQAQSAYNEALAIDPRSVEAMRGLARVYRREQRYEEAERLLLMAVDLQPGNWRALNALGGFYFTSGRYREAAESFGQVAAIDETNFQALNNTGSALILAGEFDNGQAVLQKSLAIEETPGALSNLGIVHYYKRDFLRSVEVHRRAVEIAHGESLKWINLGDSLHFAGGDDEARDAFQRAVKLATDYLEVNPNSPGEILTLAWARQMLGETSEVRQLLARAIEMQPRDPYMYYYKALVEVQDGQLSLALDTLGDALEAGYPWRLLAAEPYLDPLRGDGALDALLDSYRN